MKRFMFNPQIIKSVMEQNNEEPGAKYSLVAMETTEKLQRICSNVVGYCKTVMNSAGKWIRILDFYNKMAMKNSNVIVLLTTISRGETIQCQLDSIFITILW